MNPQIPIEARQTVLDFVTAGTSFTAYEVTREVRRRLGTSIDVPHGEVNGIVQTMFANGEIIGYDRREDQTVQAATKPFRYYQRGGAVAAPFVRPTAPAISRSGLPAALQFAHPFGAMIRNLGIAARNFQRANGKANEPFAVWVPTPKEPTFRLRCYGSGWDESEVEARFALDLNNANGADLLWLAPLAYADEFRLYSNSGGTQTQFLVRLDAALRTSVTKEATRSTGEPDGLEIEVAVRGLDFDSGVQALAMYRYLSVAPRIYCGGKTLQIPSTDVIAQGDGWKFPDHRASKSSPDSVAIVDEIGYSLRDLKSSQYLGLEIYLENVAVEPSLGKLVQNGGAIEECERIIENFKSEIAPLMSRRLQSAANLWDARILWDEIIGNDGQSYGLNLLAGNAIAWRGIAIERNSFRWSDGPAGVKAREYLPSSKPGKILDATTVNVIVADPDSVVLINDLGWDKSASSRVAQLYQTTPFKAAYVLSFENEAARVKFYRDRNFDTVPTRFVSELPRKARAASVASASQTRNSHPFNAQLHQPKSPASPIMASFAYGNGGSDDDFAELKKWARQTPLDNNTWPDFKRLYKAIEARLWPPMGRFRYDKTEADFPNAPIPSARELEILGVLMGRLDERNAARGNGAPVAPTPTIAQRALSAVNTLVGRASAATANGPRDETLAYMKRRATKLLVFLRDNDDLSVERRAALAPMICGLLQRDKCADIDATLPLRLNLVQTDILADSPDAIARVWNDASLPLNIARWSYNWLESQGQTIAVSPAQLRRFVEVADVEMTLKLAPAALASAEKWPQGFNLQQFSRALQGELQGPANSVWMNSEFLKNRDQIINLFARFSQLEPDTAWLRDSLGAVSDEFTLDWLQLHLTKWAGRGQLALIQKMSAALQSRYNATIVTAFPTGFSLDKWRELVDNAALLGALSRAMRELPIATEIADFIWALPTDKRAPILSALEDNPALLPIIESHARELDWAFIAPLSAGQWQGFARVVGQTFSDGIGADNWAQIGELPFESGYESLPLGAGFWQWIVPLESELRAQWFARVGVERAATNFTSQSAAVFEWLLDLDATGVENLGDAWLDANLKSVPLEGELIIKLAQSAVSDWQMRALKHLQSAELGLPVALRFMESELPILERMAAPFFSDENRGWSDHVLALADSPKMAARALALQLLEEFPARWTPELLRNLAQHDDAGMQAFVAIQLENAPARVVESRAIEAFDGAILNARGRARRAKESVKARVSESDFNKKTLLEAARNGAARDREWALQQLVFAAMAGESVEGLEISEVSVGFNRRKLLKS